MIYYRPDFIPNRFVIFGVGGTGSRLVPLVAQFIRTCNWIINPEIALIDPDVVEDKNLSRQNFVSIDVGKSKSQVLASRYSRAFNTNIISFKDTVKALPSYPEDSAEKYIYLNRIQGLVVFLCVDSVSARQEIIKFLRGINARNMLIIDAGNENDFGQVHISSSNSITFNFGREYLNKLLEEKMIPVDMELPAVPYNDGYFTNMVSSAGPSCAELDQTMAINTLMAVNMFGVLQQFVYNKPINFHRLDISLAHGAIPQYFTLRYLNEVGADRNPYNSNHPSKSIENQLVKLYDAVNKFKEELEKSQAKSELDGVVTKPKRKPRKATEEAIEALEEPTPVPGTEYAMAA